MKQIVQTDKSATPRGPYSQGVIATGSTLYVAAQGPNDPETGERVDGTFEEQADRVFRNIHAIVTAAGASMADVAKVTVFFTDWQYFAALNAIYEQHFPEPYPARTPVQMEIPGALIMADAVVVLESP